MAIGAGIGASLGIATESVFNNQTSPTVDHFYEFNTESTKYTKNTVVGQGLRAGGLTPRVQRRVVTTFAGSGDFEIDLPTRALGLLLAHACGGTFPTPSQIGSTGVYTTTFTPGDTYNHSFVTQVGVPQYGGTVTPKTLTGCKITNFEISVGAGDIAKGKFTIDAANLKTSYSYSSPVYPYSPSPSGGTSNLFHFAQGVITDNASTTYANIKDFTFTVDNALKTDRYNLGSAGAKQEQIINGFRAITGKVTAEFTDTVLLDKFLADTTAGLKLTFTGATIGSSGTNKELLSITIPACKFDGDVPAVGGPGVIDVSFGFTVYDNGTDPVFTITTQSLDSAL
jgi:hypothetical protein